jgi:hypothetical protein
MKKKIKPKKKIVKTNTKKNKSSQKPKKTKKPIKTKTKVSIKKVDERVPADLEIKRAKHDRVKALEGAVAKPNVSQFELNELIGKLAGDVKKRGRNKNQIKFRKVRAAFDRYN